MSDILTGTDAGVMTITLNRVDKKNAIFMEKRKPDFSRF